MRLQEFPRTAAWYLRFVLGSGAVVLLAALPILSVPPPTQALLALGLAAGCFALQVRSPVLVWRGSRLALHPDEGLLLVAFLALPAPLVLVASVVGSVAAQAHMRKPALKGAFNVATHSLSTAAGAGSMAALAAAGLSPLQSVLAVPLVVSATNQILVAALLVLLRSEPWRSVLRPGLFQSVGIATAAGLMLGLLSASLFRLHPAALLLLIPAAALGHRALVWTYHQENELTTRREVNRLAGQLVGALDDDAVAAAALRACRAAFAPLSVGIRLDGAEPREWRLGEEGERPGAGARVAEPLRDEHGNPVGELWLHLSRKEGAQLDLDRELVKLVASHLSLSLANARLLSSLRRSERRLRQAFDAARDPVVLVTREGKPLYANARALALAGEDAGLEGALWAALDDASVARLLAALAQGPGEAAIELQSRGSDERRRHFEADLSLLPLDDGTVGCLVVARDVTERRRLEREAERQREALERSERLSALGVLVAGIAHEINNPLTYMRGNLDLAAMDLQDLEAGLAAGRGVPEGIEIPEIRRQLDTARSGVTRIERITKGLKVVAGTRSPGSLAPLRLDALVDRVERAVAATLPAGVTLRVAPGTEDALVAGEEGDLRQAVLNLVRNGVDAVAERGGTVDVRVRVEGEHAVVEVADDGPGIPADARPKLFTPFFTTKPDGTGLGLPTTYTIVKNHGGAVEVDDGTGPGATFRIRLPLYGGGHEEGEGLAARVWPGGGARESD